MIRRSLQIILLSLVCGVAALALLAHAAEPDGSGAALIVAQAPSGTPATPPAAANGTQAPNGVQPGGSPAANTAQPNAVQPGAPQPNAAQPNAAQPAPAAQPNAAPPAAEKAASPQPAEGQPGAAPPAGEVAAEPPAANVAGPKLDELLQPVNELSGLVDAAEKQLETAPRVQSELAALRGRIEKIQIKAKAAGEALKPRLEEVRAQIEKLGKPPEKDAPPEAPEVTQERNRLNALAAQIDGAIKKAALTEERAGQLISRVQHVRQGIFTRLLLWQTNTPLQPQVWSTAAKQLTIVERQGAFILGNWLSTVKLRLLPFLAVLLAAAGVFVLLRLLANRLMQRWSAASAAANLPLHERAGDALRSIIANVLPGAAAAGVLYVGLDEAGLLYWQVERFAQAAFFSFLFYLGISSLARAVLQPARPRWRVLDIDDTAARRICLALSGIAAVYAIDDLVLQIIAILSLSPTASIVSAFVASLAYAALIMVVVQTPLAPRAQAPGAPVSPLRRIWIKALLLLIGGVLLGASLFGFVALTRFIAGQILMTGSGIMVIALVHLAIGGVRPQGTQAASEAIGSETTVSPDDLRRQRFARATRFALNALLAVVGLPLILMTWGLSGPEIASGIRAIASGFEIGGVRISLLRIFMGLLLFVILLVSTRLLQRWLASQALPRAHIEAGLANSIYTGVGYVGFAVALLAAVAYAGFDITSLAIVAGALSVGIGFGLQGIVNNFVSGLVLLVERPIKVGDWISLNGTDGYVRRISVRSTEIETFNRASVIVPNSELVTQIVTNLTHRNLLGRLDIGVRVSYAADPERAAAVLREVASKSTSVLRYPPPIVVLDNLGDQAMEFSVRVYLADINRSLDAQTEIRTQIVKSLRKAGIDIPYFAVQIGHSSGPRAVPERVSVRINVALNADPEAVIEALSLAARQCAGASEDAQAEVKFDNVGDTALEFSVSVAIDDGATAGQVETALRVAAVKTLRRYGIALANSQAHRQQAIDALRAELYREEHDGRPDPTEGGNDNERGAKPPLREQ